MSKTLCAILMASVLLPLLPALAVGQSGIAPPTRIPDPVVTSNSSTGVPTNTVAIPREVRRTVVADAARRFKVATSQVVLTRAEQMTWSDGSLGCPEPGRVYTQSVVTGFRVVAKTPVGERIYHTDSGGIAVSCAPKTAASADALADKPVKGNVPRTWPRPPAPPDR